MEQQSASLECILLSKSKLALSVPRQLCLLYRTPCCKYSTFLYLVNWMLKQVHFESRVGISVLSEHSFHCYNSSVIRICCCWVKQWEMETVLSISMVYLCWELVSYLKLFLGEIGWQNFQNGVGVKAECTKVSGFIFWLPPGFSYEFRLLFLHWRGCLSKWQFHHSPC